MDASHQLPDLTTRADLAFVSTLTAKGGVTILIAVRRLLKVKPKEKLVFRVRGKVVHIEPGPMTLEEVMGSVKPLQPHKSLKEIRDETIEEHAERVVAKMKP